MENLIIPSTSSVCYMVYVMFFTKLLEVNIEFNEFQLFSHSRDIQLYHAI